MFRKIICYNFGVLKPICKIENIFLGTGRVQFSKSTRVTPLLIKKTHPPNTFAGNPALIDCLTNRNFCTNPEDAGTGKKKKSKKNPPAVDHVGRLDLRIGKIVDITKAPDAETLYLTKVDCGEPFQRSIVAGLTKYWTIEELQDRLVVVLCNLKATKLRGHLSEGMIVCANGNDLVEPLNPPENSIPGDLVHCENFERVPVETPRDKKRLFDPIADGFQTNDQLIACYKDSHLYVPGKGEIVAKKLKKAPIS